MSTTTSTISTTKTTTTKKPPKKDTKKSNTNKSTQGSIQISYLECISLGKKKRSAAKSLFSEIIQIVFHGSYFREVRTTKKIFHLTVFSL